MLVLSSIGNTLGLGGQLPEVEQNSGIWLGKAWLSRGVPDYQLFQSVLVDDPWANKAVLYILVCCLLRLA